jgi:hypothetical protein
MRNGADEHFLGWLVEGQFVNGKLSGAKFQKTPPEEFLKTFDEVFYAVYGVRPKKEKKDAG